GVVYKARHVVLNRLVALKMSRSGELTDQTELARFRAEAEAVARLRHPNIVQIYEVGDCQGRPFFCFEYVDGGSLADFVRGTPQWPGGSAEWVEVRARAIHVAHQQGIIHRDLKPANILLVGRGPAGGDPGQAPTVPAPSDGSVTTRAAAPLLPTAKIADFGV